MLMSITKAAKELDIDEDELLILLKNLPGRNFVTRRGKVLVDLDKIIDIFHDHSIAMPEHLARNPRQRRDDEDADEDDDEE